MEMPVALTKAAVLLSSPRLTYSLSLRRVGSGHGQCDKTAACALVCVGLFHSDSALWCVGLFPSDSALGCVGLFHTDSAQGCVGLFHTDSALGCVELFHTDSALRCVGLFHTDSALGCVGLFHTDSVTRLQHVCWCVWGCFTRTVWCLRQAKAVQMGAKMAEFSAKTEDGGLSVT